MEDKLRTPGMDALFTAILSLKDTEECYAFFEDLCTIHELNAMSQRYEVAKMLDKGCVYGDIAGQTGASTATISRVARALNYGKDGYRLLFDRQKEAR